MASRRQSARRATARHRQGRDVSLAPVIVAGGLAVGAYGVLRHYPGVVAIWLGLLVAAWAEPPAVMTGPTDARGRPRALDEREAARDLAYRFWRDLRTRLLLPTKELAPRWPVLGIWPVALTCGVLAWTLQCAQPDWRWLNAGAAVMTVLGVAASRRAATGSPGTRLDALPAALTSSVTLVAIQALAGLAAGTALVVLTPKVASAIALTVHQAGRSGQDMGGPGLVPPEVTAAVTALSPSPAWLAAAAVLALGLAAGLAASMRPVALAAHRELVAARTEWAPRWEALKMDPAPTLVSTMDVAGMRVDTFETHRASRDSAARVIARAGDLTPMLGSGVTAAVLACPDVDLSGAPQPGAVHPNRFQVVRHPAGQGPDLTSPELDETPRALGGALEWAPRWSALKLDPAPLLESVTMVGPFRVDSFAIPASSTSSAPEVLARHSRTIAGMLGSGMQVATLVVLDGAAPHPRAFQVVRVPEEHVPDISAPGTSEAIASLAIETSIRRQLLAQDMHAYPIGSGLEPLSAEDSPDMVWVWRGHWPVPDPLWEHVRRHGMLPQVAGLAALVDHRAQNRFGEILVGALHDPGVRYADEGLADARGPSATAKRIRDGLLEDDLFVRWGNPVKSSANPPVVQTHIITTRALHDGTRVTSTPYAVRLGMDAREHANKASEAKLTTALAVRYITVTGWVDPAAARVGERNASAFRTLTADRPVPATPAALPPSPAAEWVLAGHVNAAFDAAGLPRPEVVSSRCLTLGPGLPGSPRSAGVPGRIWQVRLRLYDGVTLADIRTRAAKLAQAFGCPWLRVAEAVDGVMLYVGESPSKTTITTERDRERVIELDWEQAFLDAGVIGQGGRLPAFVSSRPMERNPNVEVIEFNLPPGLAVTEVREAKTLEKLKSNTGNAFVDVRASERGASSMTVLASASDPMPAHAPYDYEQADASAVVPFATLVDGETAVFDVKESPHLLVAGGSGSGKSAALEVFLTGFLLRGFEAFVVDPTKGAADFRFAQPWLRACATDYVDAAATLKGVYEIVKQRKTLNSQYGVGSYRDLPEQVRPRPVVVLIDEFESLLLTTRVTRTPLDDDELERERRAVIAENDARITIGQMTGNLAREARSAGVTLLLAAQKLKADSLNSVPGAGTLRTNLARLLLGSATFGDKQSALRNPEEAPDPGVNPVGGRGIYEPSAGRPVAVQVWYDAPQNLADHLRQRVPPEDNPFDPTPFIRTPKDADAGDVEAIHLDTIGLAPSAVSDSRDTDLGELTLDLDDLEVQAGDGQGAASVPHALPELDWGDADDEDDDADVGDDGRGRARRAATVAPVDPETPYVAAEPEAAIEATADNPGPYHVTAPPFAQLDWDDDEDDEWASLAQVARDPFGVPGSLAAKVQGAGPQR